MEIGYHTRIIFIVSKRIFDSLILRPISVKRSKRLRISVCCLFLHYTDNWFFATAWSLRPQCIAHTLALKHCATRAIVIKNINTLCSRKINLKDIFDLAFVCLVLSINVRLFQKIGCCNKANICMRIAKNTLKIATNACQKPPPTRYWSKERLSREIREVVFVDLNYQTSSPRLQVSLTCSLIVVLVKGRKRTREGNVLCYRYFVFYVQC